MDKSRRPPNDGIMSDRIQRLRAQTVLDPDGQVHTLASVLDRGTVVLAFIRHFG